MLKSESMTVECNLKTRCAVDEHLGVFGIMFLFELASELTTIQLKRPIATVLTVQIVTRENATLSHQDLLQQVDSIDLS